MLDQVIILLYLLLTLVIGVYFKSPESSSKFFTSSKELKDNRFIMMASVFSTSVGAGTIFGLTSKVFSGEITYAYALIISVIADLLVIFFLVPKIVSFSSYSNVGDVVEKYYGKFGKVIYGFAVILVSLGYLAAQIKVSSEIFGYFTYIPNLYGVIISYVIVILYTSIGGFRSIILTDVIQFCFMVISIPYIAFYCMRDEQYYILNSIYDLSAREDILKNSLALAFAFFLMSINPPYLHRILASGNTRHVQSSSYIKTLIYVIFIIMIIVIALYARYFFSNSETNAQILPLLINEIIPAGWKGVVFCGILGALMSTADSNLHMGALSFVHDIIEVIFNLKCKILVTRIFIALFGICSMLLVLNFNNVIDIVVFMSGFWGAIMFVPLIFLFYNIYIKKWQLGIAALSGLITFLYMQAYNAGFILAPSLLGAVANLSVFLSSLIANKRIKNKMGNFS